MLDAIYHPAWNGIYMTIVFEETKRRRLPGRRCNFWTGCME